MHCLFNSWSQLCYVDKCKIVMLPSSETFHLRTCLKSIFKYFVERWKIVPVKECQLSLFMTGRCVLTSIFKITIKFAFFWYIACLVPRISNIFEKYPLISWSITKEFYYDIKSSKSPQYNDFFRTCYFYRGLMLSDGHLKEIEIATIYSNFNKSGWLDSLSLTPENAHSTLKWLLLLNESNKYGHCTSCN